MVPSAYLLNDEVTLTINVWGKDADGSGIVASTRAVPCVPCAVLPGKGRTDRSTDPNTGLDRVTRITPYSVHFDEDVGLSIEDLVAWWDWAGGPHTLIVDHYGPDALPGYWVANCEERA